MRKKKIIKVSRLRLLAAQPQGPGSRLKKKKLFT